MVIWKDDMPFIVKDVSDLKQIIDDEVFVAIEKFIEEYVDDSEEVSRLYGEISDLEEEVASLEEEVEELSDTLEKLKEKYGEHKGILPILKDFMEAMEGANLNKDQAYYWDRLKDVID